MAVSLKPKVAQVVSTQLPQVIADNSDYLTEFLSQYYNWLDDNAVKYVRDPLSIVDIDNTSNEIVTNILSVLLTTTKQTPNAALIVKNIRALFENKGNLKSYEFLFNLLFGEEVELDWGRDHVLKPSENTYTQNIWITVQLDIEAGAANFLGMRLVQPYSFTQNNATGIIDSQNEVSVNGKNLYRFKLQENSISGTFVRGATCEVKDRLTGVTYTGTIGHILGKVNVKNKGSLYRAGDRISMFGGSGVGGTGYIKDVTSGSIDNVFIIDGGDGYEVGDTIEFNSTQTGGAASATVVSIGGAGAVIAPTVTCDEVVIENGGAGYEIGNQFTISSSNGSATVEVDSVGSTGRVTGISVSSAGAGYDKNSSLFFYADLTNITVGNAVRVTGTNTLNPMNGILDVTFASPSLIIAPSVNVMINGNGAEMWVTCVSGGNITTVAYNTGYNYYMPSVYCAAGASGFNLPLTVDSWGRINGIGTITHSGAVVPVTDNPVGTNAANATSLNVAHINRYKIGYGVVIDGKLSARVSAITHSNLDGTGTISLNAKTSQIVNIGDTVTIYPVVLNVVDSRKGNGAVLIANTDKSAVKSVKVLDGGAFKNTDNFTVTNVTGIGKNVIVTPYFRLKDLTVDAAGKFYNPLTTEVQFSDTHGYGADIRAIVDNGVINTVAVTAQGSGYTWATIKPNVISGSGANLIPIIDDGKIIGVKYADRGRGYSPSDTFNITGDGVGATLGGITVRDKSIRKVVVYSGGRGYYPNDVQYDIIAKDNNGAYTAPFEGYGSGSGALFTPVVYDGTSIGDPLDIPGRIKQINVTNTGSGYTNVYLKLHGNGYKAELQPVMGTAGNAGKVMSVNVLDRGFAYWWDNSTTVELFQGVEAKLDFVIKGGVVQSVEVLEPGEGYRVGETTISLKQNDIYWDPGDPTLMDYIVPMLDFYSTYPHAMKESVVPTAVASVSTLSVDNLKLENRGFGYSVIPKPLEIKAVSNRGSGAVLIPVIAGDVDSGQLGYRRIADVRVVEQGQNYDDNTRIVISGGRVPSIIGEDAELVPVIENGRIVSVSIVDGSAGSEYYYGTKIYVVGNGTGANLAPIVNTGIIRVNVLSIGNTVPGDAIILSDIGGSGATFTESWDNGVLSIKVETPGSGYILPKLTKGNAVFEIIHGEIDGINVISSGADYSAASIIVQGDGTSAYVSFKTGLDGAITKLNVHHAGTRMGGVPTVKAVDTSDIGNISAIRVTAGGTGFFEIPDPIITSALGKGAVVVPYGANIGSVKSVQFDDFGLDYVDPPYISSLFRTILGTKQTINIGEKIRIPGTTYGHDDGPIGVITEFDASKNLVTIFLPHIDVTVDTENDYNIVSQHGVPISLEGVDSLSTNWECDTSKKVLVPLVETRMFGTGGADGTGYEEPVREKSSSVLNNSSTMMTNHYDIQEYGYTIYTGIDIKEYSKIVSNILHPAGYQMVGKIRDYAYASAKMRTEYEAFGVRAGDIIRLTIYLDDADSRGMAAPVSIEGYVIDTWSDWPTRWTFDDRSHNEKYRLRFQCQPIFDQVSLYDIDAILTPQTIVKTIGGTTYTLNKLYPGSTQGWVYLQDGTPMATWEHLTIEEFEQSTSGSWYNPVYKDYTKPYRLEDTVSTDKVWMHELDRVSLDSFVIKSYYTLS